MLKDVFQKFKIFSKLYDASLLRHSLVWRQVLLDRINRFIRILRWICHSAMCRQIAGTLVLTHLPELVGWSRKIVGAATIGLYPAGEHQKIKRSAQRVLVDATKTANLDVWRPLDSILTGAFARKSDNGHAISGGNRDTARNLIDSAISAAGLEKFEISPSDYSANGEVYQHMHYAPADLARDMLLEGTLTEKAVLTGIDIDYYIENMGELLGLGYPFIFHTFNPRKVAGLDGDCFYRIVDNTLIYDVSGGSVWRHKVWDWCGFGEFIRSMSPPENWWDRVLGWLGIHKYVYHKVYHSRPWKECPERVLVWGIPMYKHKEISWIKSDMNYRTLKRMSFNNPNKPGWNQVVYQDNDQNPPKLMVSFGREGNDLSIVMAKEDLDLILGLDNPQSVTSRLIGIGIKEPKQIALILQYFQGKKIQTFEIERIGASMKPRVHWPATMEADAPEVSSRTYSSPVVADCNLMPMIKRWEAMSSSIDQRVTFVKNDKTPNRKIQRLAMDFVEQLVPRSGHGVPYGIDETIDMLDKPTQQNGIRQIIDTLDMPPRALIESFMKNEATMKNGRIISSFPDYRFLVKFSSYTLKFRDEVLHAPENRHWFYPGATPPEIAIRLRQFVMNSVGVAEADYDNMDGSVSAWLQRHVMNAVYHRYFHGLYLPELREYTSMLISCPARSKTFHFKYESGHGVKSGSPTTCDLNTVLNGFIQFCAISFTYPELSPLEAFALIGPSFGDDGVIRSDICKNISKVVENVGMKIKVERYDSEKGLSFLARVYPDIIATTTSFQDPLRTLRKLHITTRDPNVPIADAVVDRLEGYLVTDRFTPLISDYCRKMIGLYESKASSWERRARRRCQGKEKPYWLFGDGCSWPQKESDVDLMRNCICYRIGISDDELTTLVSNINSLNNPWSDFTIRKAEYPPYKQTVLPDGGLSEDVDISKLPESKKNAQDRGGGKLPPTDGGNEPTPSSSTKDKGVQGRTDKKGSDCAHQMRGGGNPKDFQVHAKPNGKASRGGMAPRGGRGRHGRRPGQQGKAP
nr:RNA-dependent RNA polymerase [Flumine nodavirus 1]